MKTASPPIQVVERTFELLEFLAREYDPVRSVRIAEKLRISEQSANNLLRVLFRLGYVSQDKSRRYRLGPQCCLLGNAADRWEYLRKASGSTLLDLSAFSGFGSFIGVLENDRLYCCAHVIPGEQRIRSSRQDWTEELHSTACGRILLAALSTTERKKLFARTTRRKITKKTVIAPEELEKICLKTKKDGFAEVREESRVNACSIAIPLHDFSGAVIAGLALHGDSADWGNVPKERKLALLETARERLEKR